MSLWWMHRNLILMNLFHAIYTIKVSLSVNVSSLTLISTCKYRSSATIIYNFTTQFNISKISLLWVNDNQAIHKFIVTISQYQHIFRPCSFHYFYNVECKQWLNLLGIDKVIRLLVPWYMFSPWPCPCLRHTHILNQVRYVFTLYLLYKEI